MPTVLQGAEYVHATANYKAILSDFKAKPLHKVNGRTKGKAHMCFELHTIPNSVASPKSNIRSSLAAGRNTYTQ